MRRIILIAHNIRSCHNVGSLLRTADGFGIERVYLTGYTPYPLTKNDPRMPHIASKVSDQIHKTALGAENSVDWSREEEVLNLIRNLKTDGFLILALEQTSKAVDISAYMPPQKVALIVGNEVEGIEKDILKSCDAHLHIPMRGKKESFNVATAAGIALYALYTQ